MLAVMTHTPAHEPLIASVPMTVTFVSETKKFAFLARHDTGESVYVSPMLAEQAGLDRKSAGRVLVATIAANVDDVGANSSTPWRVMSWETSARDAPRLVENEVDILRADLEEARRAIDQLRLAIDRALARLN